MGNAKKIRGIIPPMVTPLSCHDRLDRDGSVNLVEHMIGGGVHGIFILGTTGEAQSLSSRIKRELVELVCSSVHGRIPVLVGITDTSFQESLDLAAFARDKGARGLVAAPPYYFPMSQIELQEYYLALADAVPLPLYIYNMPSHVKTFVEIPTVERLVGHPNIAGLKDSSANLIYFNKLCHLFGRRDDFSLYVGPEELTGECILLGADGGINGGANIFPEIYVSMFDAADRGDVTRVKEIQKRIMSLSSALYTIGKYTSSNLKGIKCALSLLGICDGYIEWPFRKFLPSEHVLVRKALLDLGFKDLK